MELFVATIRISHSRPAKPPKPYYRVARLPNCPPLLSHRVKASCLNMTEQDDVSTSIPQNILYKYKHLSHLSKSHLDVVSSKVVCARKSSFLLATATCQNSLCSQPGDLSSSPCSVGMPSLPSLPSAKCSRHFFSDTSSAGNKPHW